MHSETEILTQIIKKAAEKARIEQANQPDRHVARASTMKWPVDCNIGPGQKDHGVHLIAKIQHGFLRLILFFICHHIVHFE